MRRILRLVFKPGYLSPTPTKGTLMDKILEWIRLAGPRLKVILTAAVTWLLVAEAVVLAFADEIAPLIPAPWADRISTVVLSVLAVIGAAITIIRRVTPVLPSERGILD